MGSRGVVAVVGLAAALVAVGVVLALTAAPVSFGWFASGPPGGDELPAGLGEAVVLTRRQGAAAVVVAVGLALLAAAVGYLIGRRRPPRS